MTASSLRLAFLGLIASASLATSTQAATLTLNPTADTYLRGGSSDQSWGGATELLISNHATVGPFTGLFRFDLSSLPTSGISIDSVTLTLKSNANGSGTSVTMNVYQLASANADWIEGALNGVNSGTEGSAAWNNKANFTSGPNAALDTPWAGSVGARTAGTDYTNTLLASYTGDASTAGTSNLVFTSQASISSTVLSSAGGNLNLWIGQPTVVAISEFFRITSKEGNATATSLVINYSAIPEPSTYAALAGLGVLGLAATRRRSRRV